MRHTTGSLQDLPPECLAAVKRAMTKDGRNGSGDAHDFALVIARAVWRAGIKRGRELERRQGKPMRGHKEASRG